MRLLSVVLGTPTDESRATDSIRLLRYGFRFYGSHLLYPAKSVVATPRIWFGDKKTIPAGVLGAFYITLPHSQFQNVSVNIHINPNIKAPVKQGQTLGTINAVLRGKTIATQPLVALTNDQKGGWWRCSTDSVTHKFHQWFSSKKNEKALHPKQPPVTANIAQTNGEQTNGKS